MTDLPMRKLSLKWGMVEGDMSVLEKFQMLAELGFDGVELDAPNELRLDDVLAARNATGLELPGVINAGHWQAPLTDPDPEVRRAGFEGVVRAIATARDLGAETVLLVPGVVTRTTSYRAAYDHARSQIEALLPHAEAAGVKIGLENVWNNFLLSPIEAARFLDEFSSEYIGWYLDIGNLVKNTNPEDWIEELKGRIIRVDLKEYSLAKMNKEGPWKGFDVALGEGDCDWSSINAALRRIGYSGWASAEVPGGDRARLAEVLDGMRRIRDL